MKKKFLAALLALCSFASTIAFAEDVIPTITTSTGKEICLDIPQGEFVDGVFMVPVRRIHDL